MGNSYQKKEITHGLDEVTYRTHETEFQRFYANHKLFCDEVAGVKPRTIKDGKEYKEYYITEENFVFAIRKLIAFVVDNLHYIKNVSDVRKMEQLCYGLEEEFRKDERYEELVNKVSPRPSEKIELKKRYLLYVMRVYEIGNLLVNLLQNSLMVATSTVRKDIEYYNTSTFFHELATYRNELSESISNFRFSDTLLQLKKIVAYTYTYKILMKPEERDLVDYLIKLLIEEILKEDVILLMQKAADQKKPNLKEKEKMLSLHSDIKRALLKIYYITNKNLSERKILPKIVQKIHIDKTLI